MGGISTQPADDLRQRRTREALYAALDAMLGERPYAKISVSDLTQRAGVGRPTFYRHFSDIDAMLVARLRHDLAEQLVIARAELAEAPDFQIALRRLATFAFQRVGEKPAIYRLILSGEAGSGALALFRDQIAQLLALVPPAPQAIGADIADYVASFYAGAISATLLSWIDAGRAQDAETMGALFVQLLGAGGQAGAGFSTES